MSERYEQSSGNSPSDSTSVVDGVVAADDNGEGGGDAEVVGYAGVFGINLMTPPGKSN